MALIPELLLAIVELAFKQAVHANDFTHFINLASANKSFFSMAIRLLWRELPSAQPLLHLLPTNVVVRSLSFDYSHKRTWHYKLRRIPFTSDLDRLHTYTSHIHAIRACGRPSLNTSACDVFLKLFQEHLSIPTLPCIERIQLTDPGDTLTAYIPNLLHSTLRVLQIPSYGINVPIAMAQVMAVPPPLHTLTYVDVRARMQHFAQSIHLFPRLRDLTVSLLEPIAMQAIASLAHLTRLEIVINPSRDTISTHPYDISFHHRLTSLIFTLVESPSLDVTCASFKHLLMTFPLSCDKLTIGLPTRLQGLAMEAFVRDLNPPAPVQITYVTE